MGPWPTVGALTLTAIHSSTLALCGGRVVLCPSKWGSQAPHTTSIPTTFSLADSIPIGGVSVSQGAVVQLSTTYGTGTLAGAYLNAAAAR